MGTLRLVATGGAGGLIFVRRIHDLSSEFPRRPFSSVNSSQLRPPTSGCSRRESLLHVAAAAGPGTSNKSGGGGRIDQGIRGVIVDIDVENTDRNLLEKERYQELISPSLMMHNLDGVNPIGLGRITHHLFDELWRQLSGFAHFSCSSVVQNFDLLLVMKELGRDASRDLALAIPSSNSTVLIVDSTSNTGRKLRHAVSPVKRSTERLRMVMGQYHRSLQLVLEYIEQFPVENPPDKANSCLRPGPLFQKKNSSYCGGAVAGAVLNLLAAAIVLSASNPQAQAMARPLPQQQNDPNQETLSNIPPFLSPSSPSESKSSQIQHPKSRKAETCTVKCLNTCIRGEDGVGPLNVRRPIVVFKSGFRSRKYCLVECSDICNLIKDGDDGP